MEKLNGKKKLRVSVFISGRGTNLKSLINFSNMKNCPIKIVLVITNNKNAKGIYIAKKNDHLIDSIPVYFNKRIHGTAKGGGGSLKNRLKLIKRTYKYIKELSKS